MSKENYFKIQSNKTHVFYDIEWSDSWIIYFDMPLYQDQVQKLVKEFKKPINKSEDINKLILWINKKKQIRCDVIPKIYFIENNGHPFKERMK